MSRQDPGAANQVGQTVIPAGARWLLEILAEEFDRLAEEQDGLRRAARLRGSGYATDAHRIRMHAYRRAAWLTRALLPGGVK